MFMMKFLSIKFLLSIGHATKSPAPPMDLVNSELAFI